jgi:hypothetical protein
MRSKSEKEHVLSPLDMAKRIWALPKLENRGPNIGAMAQICGG